MALILSGNSGNTTLDSSNGLTFSDASLQGVAASPYVLKNRIINGSMQIDQRNAGAAQTISAGSSPYTIDRWYLYSAGASVTGQRVAGTLPNQYAYRITGNTSNTNITFGQRIESYNTFDLTNQTVTLSFTLSSSSLTTATWNIYYPNATDNFTSTTSITSGSITINSTPTRYSVSINAGANAGNGLGIEFGNNITGLGSGQTFTIQNVQLEVGTSATPFERRLYNQELSACQRYFGKYDAIAVTSANTYSVTLPTTMRAAPTCTNTVNAGSGSVWAALNSGTSLTGILQGTGNSLLATATISCSAEL